MLKKRKEEKKKIFQVRTNIAKAIPKNMEYSGLLLFIKTLPRYVIYRNPILGLDPCTEIPMIVSVSTLILKNGIEN